MLKRILIPLSCVSISFSVQNPLATILYITYALKNGQVSKNIRCMSVRYRYGTSLEYLCKTQLFFSKFKQEIKNSFRCSELKAKVCTQVLVLKLRHYEKATKLEKISHLFWQNSCFYSVVSKQVGDFFKFLWPSQKSWTLKLFYLSYITLSKNTNVKTKTILWACAANHRKSW